MKKLIILFFVCSSLLSYSQTKEILKSEVQKMYTATLTMNYDAIISYTYPKLFDLINEDEMKTILQTTFDNETMTIRIVNENPTFNYGELKKIEDKTVCLIDYQNAMRMTFTEKLNNEEAQEMRTSFLDTGEFHTVTFDNKTNSFLIEGKSYIIAITDALTKGEWKFLNYSKNQNEIAKNLLGEKTMLELGF